MKKSLIIAIAALTLFSCGGGNKTQNADGDGEHTVSTTESDELSRITCEVLKYGKTHWKDEDRMGTYQLYEEDLIVDNITDYPQYSLDSPDPESSRSDSVRYYAILDGGFDDLWSCSFSKRKSGGYWIWIELESRSGDCPDCTSSHYKAVTYIDGVIKDATPNPSLSDFYANYKDFPKDALKYLENIYNRDFSYNFNDDTLKVSFSLYEQFGEEDEDGVLFLNEVLPRPFAGFEMKKDPKVPSVAYVWNGDDYVISPNYKPYNEDIQYFETGKSFARSGKYPIELYITDDDHLSYADLNHDGMEDLVINNNEYKEFAVYFKNKEEIYNLVVTGHCPEDVIDNPEFSLHATAKKDTLHVTSSFDSLKDYVFYYKKDNFYLLKYTDIMDVPDNNGNDYEEIDFVKHKLIRNDKKEDIPPYPLLRLEDVPLGWWTLTAIYSGCNMLEIWKQLDHKNYDSEAEKEDCIRYRYNYLEYTYTDEYNIRERRVACFPRKQEKDTIVFDTYYVVHETQSGIFSNHLNEMIQYIYKDGKLTQIELQEDLKPYTSEKYQSEIDFSDNPNKANKLIIREFETMEGIVFTWNGEKFVKEKE